MRLKITRKALAVEGVPEWMRISFEIALATGCRLRETQIPLDCVDLKNRVLTFPTPKGGAGKSFSIPIPAAIEPMLAKMKAEGREMTCEVPRTRASLCWRRLLDICGLKRHCFHSLRGNPSDETAAFRLFSICRHETRESLFDVSSRALPTALRRRSPRCSELRSVVCISRQRSKSLGITFPASNGNPGNACICLIRT
mgnify:CR=1 FL=1